jgi:GGDEF domain-containing protein
VRLARGGERFGCAVVTVDGFADLRRRDPGRAAMILAGLARRLRRNVRGRDALFLAGEAEFVLFFPSSDQDGVQVAVERLAATIRNVSVEGSELDLELRFGYLTVPHSQVRASEDLLAAARRGAAEAREKGVRVVHVLDGQ